MDRAAAANAQKAARAAIELRTHRPGERSIATMFTALARSRDSARSDATGDSHGVDPKTSRPAHNDAPSSMSAAETEARRNIPPLWRVRGVM